MKYLKQMDIFINESDSFFVQIMYLTPILVMHILKILKEKKLINI